jgi:2-dehydropantoate 2-reductase
MATKRPSISIGGRTATTNGLFVVRPVDDPHWRRHSRGMKIGIVGAGAIGGWVAARLAIGGEAVSVLARQKTADSLRSGLELVEGGVAMTARPIFATDASELGPQDLLIIAVKAPALAGAARAAAPMIGPQTIILPMLNGLPWWFADRPLRSVDADGAIAAALPLEQVAGCVVHAACRREGLNRVVVVKADKLILGEPEGGGERVRWLCALLERTGIHCQASANIRRDIWYKLWGNATLNPLSALTLATADRLHAELKPLQLAGMAELAAVGAAIGCPISESGEDRMAVTARLGPFKSSMLQDVEAGRPIELEAMLGAPIELARRAGVPVPTLETLYAMTRLMAESRGLL